MNGLQDLTIPVPVDATDANASVDGSSRIFCANKTLRRSSPAGGGISRRRLELPGADLTAVHVQSVSAPQKVALRASWRVSILNVRIIGSHPPAGGPGPVLLSPCGVSGPPPLTGAPQAPAGPAWCEGKEPPNNREAIRELPIRRTVSHHTCKRNGFRQNPGGVDLPVF